MRLAALIGLLMVFLSGCATSPSQPADVAVRLLEPGESIRLRVAADLMHGHDMEEPPYDEAEGYQPIPTYPGELLVTDRRLLFVARSAGPESSWASIPFGDIARARPSRTPLLHYIVVWDTDGHADSFVVDSQDVRVLHQAVGQALMSRATAPLAPATRAHGIQ